MSDLAFLSSDEEDNNVVVDEAPEEESDDDEFGNDFEFGGLLGEDGRETELTSLLSTTGKNTWSYKSALKILEKHDEMRDGLNGLGGVRERTDVASIIAEARKNMKANNDKEDDDTENTSGDEEEQAGSNNDESESESEDSDDDDDNNDDSDSGDESSDDEVDDAEKMKGMDQDVVRDRKAKLTKNMIREQDEEDSGSDDDDDDDENDESSNDSEDEEAKKEAAKAAKYFDQSHFHSSQGVGEKVEVFAQLNLSRPLLRGVASIGFVSPTPIQAKVIPIALSGRDVCASAQTGSGKTAAFLLPIMERIIQRGGGNTKNKKHLAATRALILTPTRELAAQCLGMMNAIGKFTDLRAALIVGGSKNINSQAAELRTRPDVVVATPGRLIDHLVNSSGVDLDDLEFLVLDEADRLLDLGFQDEIHEIVKSCPSERQSLLFSATMGTKVDELIKLSLKRPVRVHVSAKDKKDSDSADGVEVANRLEQEFVRVRASNEGVNREAMLLALLTRTYTKRVIVFFDTKADAHRLMILAGLCGIKCAEIHGNLTQVQRLEALEQFREGAVDVLLATDLAARGLDISSVEAVINFEMPSQVETYVHRIGRTARAGRAGKACTLIGEGRRQLMKAVMKDAEQKRRIEEKRKNRNDASSSTGAIRSRTIPTAVLKHFAAKIVSLEPHLKEVMAAEAVAKMDRIAEIEAKRAQNLIAKGDKKDDAQMKREWFTSHQERISAKERYKQKQEEIKAKIGTGMHRMTRKKRRMREAKEEIAAMQEETREHYEETGEMSKKIMTQNAMKASAKAQKRQLMEQEQDKFMASIVEEDMKQEKKRKQKEKSEKKKKRGAFASDALGDSGLFDDERVAQVQKSAFEFQGYDPDKQRKHKAKSHHGFKSKSKFKRRK
ncbi:ATP-dependent RNA helicase DDX27 [Chaetoceros tenuissimus]|uniref:ATP-dependent RNA helicase DDX27 n=1 Tax=Chaetoceros tenuissimus TaxID=426638 RepID=A0AAD3CG33_9STRA|nr:ATP-dependent RNA helicase DDX27 [Chaetoceros tenuissimus]